VGELGNSALLVVGIDARVIITIVNNNNNNNVTAVMLNVVSDTRVNK